jgi:hypothetical protein
MDRFGWFPEYSTELWIWSKSVSSVRLDMSVSDNDQTSSVQKVKNDGCLKNILRSYKSNLFTVCLELVVQ